MMPVIFNNCNFHLLKILGKKKIILIRHFFFNTHYSYSIEFQSIILI